jgi:hypothetical protein
LHNNRKFMYMRITRPDEKPKNEINFALPFSFLFFFFGGGGGGALSKTNPIHTCYILPVEGQTVALIVQQHTAKCQIFLSDHSLQLVANTKLQYLQP